MCIFHITIESIFFRSSVCTVVKRFTICLSTNVCYCFVVVPLSWQFLPVRLPQCEAGEVVFLIPLDGLPPDGRPIPFPYLNLHPILPRLLRMRKRICSSGWREAQWHTVNCSGKSGPFSWWLEDHYWLGLGVFAVVRSQWHVCFQLKFGTIFRALFALLWIVSWSQRRMYLALKRIWTFWETMDSYVNDSMYTIITTWKSETFLSNGRTRTLQGTDCGESKVRPIDD